MVPYKTLKEFRLFLLSISHLVGKVGGGFWGSKKDSRSGCLFVDDADLLHFCEGSKMRRDLTFL